MSHQTNLNAIRPAFTLILNSLDPYYVEKLDYIYHCVAEEKYHFALANISALSDLLEADLNYPERQFLTLLLKEIGSMDIESKNRQIHEILSYIVPLLPFEFKNNNIIHLRDSDQTFYLSNAVESVEDFKDKLLQADRTADGRYNAAVSEMLHQAFYLSKEVTRIYNIIRVI